MYYVKQPSVHFHFAMIKCIGVSWLQLFKKLFHEDVTLRQYVGMKGSRNAIQFHSTVGWKKNKDVAKLLVVF